MAWSDDWGNTYPTYNDAIEGIHNILRGNPEWYNSAIAEYLNVPEDILEFIREHCWDAFAKKYERLIKAAEDDWCEYYIWDLEEIE